MNWLKIIMKRIKNVVKKENKRVVYTFDLKCIKTRKKSKLKLR